TREGDRADAGSRAAVARPWLRTRLHRPHLHGRPQRGVGIPRRPRLADQLAERQAAAERQRPAADRRGGRGRRQLRRPAVRHRHTQVMSQADSRTDGDSWDLASSVGTTATMVAAARAVASREADPLFDDPYAAPLVRAVGLDFFTKLA